MCSDDLRRGMGAIGVVVVVEGQRERGDPFQCNTTHFHQRNPTSPGPAKTLAETRTTTAASLSCRLSDQLTSTTAWFKGDPKQKLRLAWKHRRCVIISILQTWFKGDPKRKCRLAWKTSKMYGNFYLADFPCLLCQYLCHRSPFLASKFELHGVWTRQFHLLPMKGRNRLAM